MVFGRREQQLRSWRWWWSWMWCWSQGVSASLHARVQWVLLSVPTPQQTKQEALRTDHCLETVLCPTQQFLSPSLLFGLCTVVCPMGIGQQHHHLLAPSFRSWDGSCSPAFVLHGTSWREGKPGKQGVTQLSSEGSMAPHSRYSCRGLGSSPSILSLEPACHQWKFLLGLPVLGLASSFPRTVLNPGLGGWCCSR